MPDHKFAESIRSTQRFFNTATKCFEECDSEFAPKPGMFTVAQHIAHAGQCITWFVEGAFHPNGMTTDSATMEKDVRKTRSLTDARAQFDRACRHAADFIDTKTRSDFKQPIAGAIMAGELRCAILEAIADHTSHHRGALSVYARLLDRVPAMPYM